MNKKCSKCGQIKSLEMFAKRSKNEYRNECKVCRKKYFESWKARRDEIRAEKEKRKAQNGFKYCSSCKSFKFESEFGRVNGKLRNHCKVCRQNESKKYRAKYPDKCKAYRFVNKSKMIEYGKKYRKDNKDVLKMKNRKYRERNKESLKEKSKLYYKNNRETVKDNVTRYYYKNKENIVKRQYLNIKKDPGKRLRSALRARFSSTLRRNSTSAINLVGCSIDDLKKYLESKFYTRKTGEIMTWDNYGLRGWHIDHIIPISKFNLFDNAEVEKAFHYTNLQPLWSEENWAKGNRIVNCQNKVNKGEKSYE